MKMNWDRFLSCLSIICVVIIGISQIYLATLVYNFQSATPRADISILVNPATEQQWTFFTHDGADLSVYGTLSNEGGRNALVKEIVLSAIYYTPNNDTY